MRAAKPSAACCTTTEHTTCSDVGDGELLRHRRRQTAPKPRGYGRGPISIQDDAYVATYKNLETGRGLADPSPHPQRIGGSGFMRREHRELDVAL